ncbi:metallophosphoesterase [Curtobacterium sp. MCJR17_043]|uniref:metallophosphoesterase n=1 Tax=Curtobacterium sp. MCJR17_043 TaxID=2175660 RepID=UPI0024E02EC1|nr:metallophosphoesterase [Curtobacterium sp. MCJR17_043]WIB35475.1 metallophosphoesterase [Curtobacterium sp. MCJR17_043]
MQPPAPGTLRILHLSDTHVTGDGALHQGTVDTTAALGALLDHLDGLDGVGLVVVSGDVSEDGSPESYATVRDLVGGWAERHGAAFVTVPGNHDQRDGFRRVLFDGHVLGEGGRPLMHTMEHHDPAVPVRGRSVVAGRRIVTVDTSVPGAGYGELSATATEHLRAALAEPAAHGSVVVLHHPPLTAPTSLHDALKLRNPGDLAAVLRGDRRPGRARRPLPPPLRRLDRRRPRPRRARGRERRRRHRSVRRGDRPRRHRRPRRRPRRGRFALVDAGPRAASGRRPAGAAPRRRHRCPHRGGLRSVLTGVLPRSPDRTGGALRAAPGLPSDPSLRVPLIPAHRPGCGE